LKITDEIIEKAKQWEQLADEYGLNQLDMYLLAHHMTGIRDILEKGKKKKEKQNESNN
jgi:hypothetical protein